VCSPHERPRQARCTRRTPVASEPDGRGSGTWAVVGFDHERTSAPRRSVQLGAVGDEAHAATVNFVAGVIQDENADGAVTTPRTRRCRNIEDTAPT
jgi:hypothetical protein